MGRLQTFMILLLTCPYTVIVTLKVNYVIKWCDH
jgi:hypothetical protein